ncbi:hypothetical protein TSUD_220290 [Trifolium subterraneum]|uniref:Uncharacterized protein n=1 Tax=Trifolium subterraneum TaxID=3900 RepID=A0A2Z6N4F2_TRISU|nr:hypothetical protein TSUD_220290 [Trifolium subterraneum]
MSMGSSSNVVVAGGDSGVMGLADADDSEKRKRKSSVAAIKKNITPLFLECAKKDVLPAKTLRKLKE